MKRIILFVATNVAVLLVLSIVLKLFGLDQAMAGQGIAYGQLLAYSLVVGFTGAIISLLMSKTIAKWSTGAQVIESPRNEAEAWLLETVRKVAAHTSSVLVDHERYWRDHFRDLQPIAWLDDHTHPNATGHQAMANLTLRALSLGEMADRP